MNDTVKEEYYAGFDVGSSAVHYALVDEDRNILYAPAPIMHFANPIGAVRQAWQDLTARYPVESIRSTAFTGSGAESYGDIVNIRPQRGRLWLPL
ncbi:MAG: hypothetical protein SWH68_17110 [Thermodesulfobacteriota bacterium]|nr:hypothetical protein [Thermodesulfobacteriota bacterium]